MTERLSDLRRKLRAAEAQLIVCRDEARKASDLAALMEKQYRELQTWLVRYSTETATAANAAQQAYSDRLDGGFRIGDPVEVVDTFKFGEWVGVPLWIAGLTFDRSGKVDVWVSEECPITERSGITTDFRVDDLRRRVLTSQEHAADIAEESAGS